MVGKETQFPNIAQSETFAGIGDPARKAPYAWAEYLASHATSAVWLLPGQNSPIDEGWLYCAIVKDLCLKKVVGYAFSHRIDTNLTLAALNMAVHRQHPSEGLIFHSDRGVQYASTDYRNRLL